MNIKTKILIPSLAAMLIMMLLGCLNYFNTRMLQQALDTLVEQGMQLRPCSMGRAANCWRPMWGLIACLPP